MLMRVKKKRAKNIEKREGWRIINIHLITKNLDINERKKKLRRLFLRINKIEN
jgi:hypothetical protein